MASEKRRTKYLFIAVVSIVVYLLIFGWVDNGLKNHTLSGHELPVGWHAVNNSLGLCVGYMSQYTAFPFATGRNLSDGGCGLENNALANWINFLIVFIASLGISLGLIQLLSVLKRTISSG